MTYKDFIRGVVVRVWESSKSTLVGLAVSFIIVLVDQFVLVANSSASPYMKVAAALALAIGAGLRSKQVPPTTPAK
jgi:hypothetical protein